ncbi:MAG: threonine--tRNA ligase [Bdellovibrionaceae bacterium]|nr:threonine--tRNA ligase [Pseudobdellovibrionaceae bacterium]
MSKISVILPDNSIKSFDKAPSVLEVAESIGSRLAKDTLGAKINSNNEVQDLRTRLMDQDTIKIITKTSPESLDILRHSAAHVLAQAVQFIWPEIKVTIGPVIDSGFYYDFDSPYVFVEEDLVKIEKKMKELIKSKLPVAKEVWAIDKAIDYFKNKKELFKVEIIQDLKTKGFNEVSIYKQGDWLDLCKGPHVQHLGQISSIKLLSVAGAYWKGDENNKQLQRIYGTAFGSEKDLQAHLHLLEEAKKRDHRILGKKLDLFFFHPYSPGAPFFTPKGTVIYNELTNYLKELYKKYNYEEVISPQIFDVDLYHKSGHYENYRENMYFTEVDKRPFSVKPMNCPGHCLIYSQKRHSYRDLPWRIADFGRLHRYERSGTMHGLSRVRSFCQDDAHIFCRLDQLQAEICSFMNFLKEVYQSLGMNEYKIYLSTRPAKRMGSDEAWNKSEEALKQALDALQLPYEINEGDGAFYGPKLDIVFIDSMKRPWQLGTLQCDFNMPEAFKLSYVGEDNENHQPIMLHRAILGSLERFLATYLEHTAGRLALWMSPVQIAICNLTDKNKAYAESINKEIKKHFRTFLDTRNEKLGFKIREAQINQVPYMIIVGDKEEASKEVSLRLRTGESISNLTIKEVVEKLKQEKQTRMMDSIFIEA